VKESKEFFKKMDMLVKVLGGFSWIRLIENVSSVRVKKEIEFDIRFFQFWPVRILKSIFIYFNLKKTLKSHKLFLNAEFSTGTTSVRLRRYGAVTLRFTCRNLPEFKVLEEQKDDWPKKEKTTKLEYATHCIV